MKRSELNDGYTKKKGQIIVRLVAVHDGPAKVEETSKTK